MGIFAPALTTVQNRVAQLNYAAFPAFNRKQGMYVGTMALRFADGDRTAIEKVFWKDENSTSEYSPVCVKVEMCSAPVLATYRVPKYLDVIRSQRLVRERPGQVEFRKKLKFAYQHTCCISRCTVPEALDGAHIDAYCGRSSDHPQNGLLLRRDLHALFDAGLLTVHYESLLVHLSPE
ncbi:MAG TPA: HNH endonuclease signature motif containing protein, partial [Candidatus Udaeobacter sp.]|nr:HNH endonuclease signature motif containing protein [Candidatus Udaeobacter sp.]